jgi:hypothetical protein
VREGWVRVVQTPPGEDPEGLRIHLVGLDFYATTRGRGPLTEAGARKNGYRVCWKHLIRRLGKVSPEVSERWRKSLRKRRYSFYIPPQYCRILD